MRTSVREFLLTVPALVSGRREFNVLLATYKTIGDPDTDPITLMPPGLIITQRTGNVAYRINPVDSPRDQVRTMEMQARRGQKQVSLASTDAESYDLAVVYAGVTAFMEALNCACAIKCVHPNTYAVVLTCDCDADRKEPILKESQDTHQIDSAVWTKSCGGETDMRDVMQGVVAAWRNRTER